MGGTEPHSSYVNTAAVVVCARMEGVEACSSIVGRHTGSASDCEHEVA